VQIGPGGSSRQGIGPGNRKKAKQSQKTDRCILLFSGVTSPPNNSVRVFFDVQSYFSEYGTAYFFLEEFLSIFSIKIIFVRAHSA